ncbi:unnamed protein product, partial [Ectocarpus sp. 12 AP-2014]
RPCPSWSSSLSTCRRSCPFSGSSNAVAPRASAASVAAAAAVATASSLSAAEQTARAGKSSSCACGSATGGLRSNEPDPLPGLSKRPPPNAAATATVGPIRVRIARLNHASVRGSSRTATSVVGTA